MALQQITIEELGQNIKRRKPGGESFSDIEVGESALKKDPKLKRFIRTPKPVAPDEKSFPRKVADFFTGSSQAFGDTLGQSIVAPGIAEDIKTGEAQQAQLSQQLREKLAQKPPEEQRAGLERLQTIEGSAPVAISEKGGLTDIAPATELSTRQIVGQGTGTVAEALGFGKLPGLGAGVGTLSKAKNLAKEGAVLGGLFGGSEAAQQDLSGGDILKSTLIGGAAGGAFGGALPALGAAGSFIGKKSAGAGESAGQRIISSLIKPRLKDLAYGKNPAKGILDEGLVFNSFEEGAIKVKQKMVEIGDLMTQGLSSPENSVKRLDLSGMLDPLDEALFAAQRTPDINPALINRLKATKSDLSNLDQLLGKVDVDVSILSPAEAAEVKKIIGSVTRFTGNFSDDELVNKALKSIYGNIKGKINKAVPGMAEINERYANLISAENALRHRDKISSRQNIVNLSSKIGTVGGVIAGTASLNPAILAATFLNFGVEKALSSPGFKTRFANWIAKSSPKEISIVANNVPDLKPVLDGLIKNVGVRLQPKMVEQELDKVSPGQ